MSGAARIKDGHRLDASPWFADKSLSPGEKGQSRHEAQTPNQDSSGSAPTGASTTHARPPHSATRELIQSGVTFGEGMLYPHIMSSTLSPLAVPGLKPLLTEVPNHAALAKAMGMANGPPTTQVVHVPWYTRGWREIAGAAVPSYNAVLLGDKRSVGTLAHEYGHISLRQTKGARALWRNLDRLASPTGGAVLGAAMLCADPDSLISKLSPYVVALGWTPTLVDEAMASLRGYKALRDSGVKVIGRPLTASELSLLRSQYLRAFSTYGLAAVGSVLGIVLVRAVQKHFKHR